MQHFLSTYVESGVRRITLAEKLRKIPLSFFGKKDLSDLTSTIMADCAQMETASSHFIPELVGACISTAFVAIGLFFFDWRMAIAKTVGTTDIIHYSQLLWKSSEKA